MKDIPTDAPNTLRFNNWIVDIEHLAKDKKTEEVRTLLDRLYLDLKRAPDGAGSVILNAERHARVIQRLKSCWQASRNNQRSDPALRHMMSGNPTQAISHEFSACQI